MRQKISLNEVRDQNVRRQHKKVTHPCVNGNNRASQQKTSFASREATHCSHPSPTLPLSFLPSPPLSADGEATEVVAGKSVERLKASLGQFSRLRRRVSTTTTPSWRSQFLWPMCFSSVGFRQLSATSRRRKTSPEEKT
jgi:hypothetical protein